jgi:hypothetical protein
VIREGVAHRSILQIIGRDINLLQVAAQCPGFQVRGVTRHNGWLAIDSHLGVIAALIDAEVPPTPVCQAAEAPQELGGFHWHHFGRLCPIIKAVTGSP